MRAQARFMKILKPRMTKMEKTGRMVVVMMRVELPS
jgi:hypothetical protein